MLDEEARAKLDISDVMRSRLRDKMLRARAIESDLDKFFDDVFGGTKI